MFGRRKSTKKEVSSVDPLALLELPATEQVEQDVLQAEDDDVAFTTRVPDIQEALSGQVSLEDRFVQVREQHSALY